MAAGGELAAVVGVGMTKFSATRGDVSMPGLVREAAERALKDADALYPSAKKESGKKLLPIVPAKGS